MKEAIKFTLEGQTGIIKKPESNTTYFTYNNTHKIMILGLLGAIIGENGYNYNALNNKDELPDFYLSLKDINIGIKPNAKAGLFHKKIQITNNSVGYASGEDGGNLVVTEQWLEKPSWDIYILSDNSAKYNKIKQYLVDKKCEYIPYLGKNDHFATIKDVKIIKNIDKQKNKKIKIDSLIIADHIDIDSNTSLDEYIYGIETESKFVFKEVMPTILDKEIGYTEFKEFILTNNNITINAEKEIYTIDNQNIFFF